MSYPTDFSDRLSPMLVKELRQGMRTNLFTIAFLLLQAFMMLCMLLGTSVDADTSSGFFWFFVSAALLVVMPIRGFGALAREIQLHTLDLIQLTRLDAWRITVGKWFALVSQSFLFVAAVLPYNVMRYFNGGVNFVEEVATLGLLFFASAVLTALIVGFSAFPSLLLRGFVALAVCIFMLIYGTVLTVALSTGAGGFLYASPSTSEFYWGIAGFLVSGIYASYFLLDLGASRIAPAAANHSTRKRLIAILFVLVMTLMACFELPAEFAITVSLIALCLTWIDGLTERVALMPSLFEPFERRALLKPFRLLLCPGWPSGLLYFLVTVPALFALFILQEAVSGSSGSPNILDLDFIAVYVTATAAVLFPLLIIHLFLYPVTFSRYYLSLYVLIQVCCLVLSFMVLAAAESSSALDEAAYMVVPLPMVSLFGLGNTSGEERYFLGASIVVIFFSLLITLIRGIPILRRMNSAAAHEALPRDSAGAELIASGSPAITQPANAPVSDSAAAGNEAPSGETEATANPPAGT